MLVTRRPHIKHFSLRNLSVILAQNSKSVLPSRTLVEKGLVKKVFLFDIGYRNFSSTEKPPDNPQKQDAQNKYDIDEYDDYEEPKTAGQKVWSLLTRSFYLYL